MPDRSLARALKLTAQDRREIADAFYEAKRQAYIETLADLATSYGYELDGDVALSAAVDRELRDEAVEHAAFVVQTINADVDKFLDRQPEDASRDAILADYEAWLNDRIANRAEQIAVTEVYSAYTDATLAFFSENGIEPDYDFGGHGGDEPPACAVCQELQATNPHPHERVLEVGVPHIGCRQNWHPNVDPDTLPDELHIGGVVAGVLGRDPLVNVAGGHDEAVTQLRGE